MSFISSETGQVKPKVLLVDDEPDTLEECAAIVEDEDFPYVTAQSGEEALALIEKMPDIGIVMTDVRMPGMDGISLIGSIYEKFEGVRPIRCVVITGHASLDLAVSAMRYEAVDFLSKPASRAEFVTALQRAASALASVRNPIDERLAALSGEISRISENLARLSPEEKARAGQDTKGDQGGEVDADFIQRVIRSRNLRSKFFPSDLFADPAWDMLLDLMAHRLGNKEISVSSLCVASGVPASTALRWIKSMTDTGMITRYPDPNDGRRFIVSLSDETATAMMHCLKAIKAMGGVQA